MPRIACLQLSPVHGDVLASQARADALLEDVEADSLDLLLLPEMAFSGYTFADRAAVLPFAELGGGGGRCHGWCRATALRLRCHVACGYVELGEGDALFNSLLVLDRAGRCVANHRKHHLYETDKSWASEGRDWAPPVSLDGVGRCFLAVCMDINPYEFVAPWEAFELASAALDARVDVVLFSSAWCTNGEPGDAGPAPAPARETLEYWVGRLEPLARAPRETLFVAADRVGAEGRVAFCGASCVLALQGGGASLLGSLDEEEEGLLVVEMEGGAE